MITLNENAMFWRAANKTMRSINVYSRPWSLCSLVWYTVAVLFLWAILSVIGVGALSFVGVGFYQLFTNSIGFPGVAIAAMICFAAIFGMVHGGIKLYMHLTFERAKKWWLSDPEHSEKDYVYQYRWRLMMEYRDHKRYNKEESRNKRFDNFMIEKVIPRVDRVVVLTNDLWNAVTNKACVPINWK